MFCNLGNIAYFRADYRRAAGMYGDARDIFLATGEHVALAMTLSNMGAAFRELGDLDQATETLEQSARYARDAGANNELAHALNNLGDNAFRRGLHAQSIDLMCRSAELFLQNGDRRNVMVSLVVVSEALAARQQNELAARLGATITAQCQALEVRAAGPEWAGVQRASETVAARLGESRYAEAERHGRLLSLEQAIALSSTAG
jgi:tetratricopeptide (TPR) repeat protein